MRLDKYLCDMQLGTRSQIREAVKKGLVTVNGGLVKTPDFKLDEKKDTVTYMGEAVAYQTPVLLHAAQARGVCHCDARQP